MGIKSARDAWQYGDGYTGKKTRARRHGVLLGTTGTAALDA